MKGITQTIFLLAIASFTIPTFAAEPVVSYIGDIDIEVLAMRANSAWSKELIAVANALAVGEQLKDGQLLKIAIAEQYNPRMAR